LPPAACFGPACRCSRVRRTGHGGAGEDPGVAGHRRGGEGATRDANNVKRDGFRHPAQTLSFFKVTPEKTVIEITPGNGWYSESWRRCCTTRATTLLPWSIRWRCPKAAAVTTSSAAATSLEKKYAAAPAQFGKTAVVAYVRPSRCSARPVQPMWC
jgi:hypothetical protein